MPSPIADRRQPRGGGSSAPSALGAYLNSSPAFAELAHSHVNQMVQNSCSGHKQALAFAHTTKSFAKLLSNRKITNSAHHGHSLPPPSSEALPSRAQASRFTDSLLQLASNTTDLALCATTSPFHSRPHTSRAHTTRPQCLITQVRRQIRRNTVADTKQPPRPKYSRNVHQTLNTNASQHRISYHPNERAYNVSRQPRHPTRRQRIPLRHLRRHLQHGRSNRRTSERPLGCCGPSQTQQ